MASVYKIQSILVSPSAWLFEKTTVSEISSTLKFVSPKEHGNIFHVVYSEIIANNLDEAWRIFYSDVAAFVEAAVFYTSSYIAFHDWRHVIVNKTKELVLVSSFQRTLGTALSIYNQQEAEGVNRIISLTNQDERLKKFLHCYRMAVLVDSPETQDAYEKYLILASEALAGAVSNGEAGLKINRPRLKRIIGEDLHNHFFQHVDPIIGKNIRNAHMHDGLSPMSKSSVTIKLVNKLRLFVKKEYGIEGIHILEEKHSPTRGLYRDDGGFILLKPKSDSVDLDEINIIDTFEINKFLEKSLLNGFTLLNVSSKPGKRLIDLM